VSPPFLKPQCEDVSWTYCIVPVNSDVLALHDEQKQGSQYTIWCFLIRRWVGVIMRGRLASNRLRVGYRAELATLTHFSVFSCTPAVSAKGKTKVSWLISFHSLIRQCFNILIRHSNSSRIRNIKIERSKQLYHNNTLPLFSPYLLKVSGCDVSWPRECTASLIHLKSARHHGIFPSCQEPEELSTSFF